MKKSTEELRSLVSPAELEDVLETLLQQENILYYEIGTEITTIEPSKHGEIALFMEEETKDLTNPRPHIRKK